MESVRENTAEDAAGELERMETVGSCARCGVRLVAVQGSALSPLMHGRLGSYDHLPQLAPPRAEAR